MNNEKPIVSAYVTKWWERAGVVVVTDAKVDENGYLWWKSKNSGYDDMFVSAANWFLDLDKAQARVAELAKKKLKVLDAKRKTLQKYIDNPRSIPVK